MQHGRPLRLRRFYRRQLPALCHDDPRFRWFCGERVVRISLVRSPSFRELVVHSGRLGEPQGAADANCIALLARQAETIAHSGLAEGAGFEPARRFITVYTLSRRAPSTARPPLHCRHVTASPAGKDYLPEQPGATDQGLCYINKINSTKLPSRNGR
jgi:hypothetical protein